ncbi:MAG: hypothetical protein Q7U41_02810 [Microbacterium sp.]|nr:hypothetical protein [Microbacterium sp.]
MTTAMRRAMLAVVTIVVLAAVGVALGLVVDAALGIRTEPATQMYSAEWGKGAEVGVQRSDNDMVMAWIARGLLLLAVLWIIIGVVASRTRLVRRPGAAAARAAWLATTRPWRARESTLGLLPLDRWLLLGIPAALLVGTRAVQTSFLSWTHLVVVMGAWVVFVLVVRLLLRRRSPWPVIAAVGGVVVLRCVVTLLALSVTRPDGHWFSFWTEPTGRTVYIAVAFTLFVWMWVAAAWALASQIGRRRATGTVLAGVGAGLAVAALIVALVGIEGALTVGDDEMGLLSWGLSRILGITVHPGIPATAWFTAGVGFVIAVVGALLALPYGRADRRAEPEAAASGDLMS